jgi:hypothetical protein
MMALLWPQGIVPQIGPFHLFPIDYSPNIQSFTVTCIAWATETSCWLPVDFCTEYRLQAALCSLKHMFGFSLKVEAYIALKDI